MRATNLRAVPSLLQLTQGFPRKKLLVVGDLVADHYIYGQTDRVSREAPVLVVRYEAAEVKLGGAANAAANVRALGGQVTALGALGDDEMGAQLRVAFKAAGVRLQAVTAPETETKTRILAGGVNTTRQQMLRLDRGARGPLPGKVRQELGQRLVELARDVDEVLVSDYGAGVASAELRAALRRLRRSGPPVCIDSRYSLRDFEGATVCKPNEPELEALSGVAIRDEKSLLDAGRAGLKLLGCQALLVTRGRNGMALFDAQGNAELLPVHGADEAVDVTGAGDTVIAAFTLALAGGASALDAARIANVAGGLVVMKQGTATVSRAELQRELGR
jgi:rfaE bifunctional protein kinase chain/domain